MAMSSDRIWFGAMATVCLISVGVLQISMTIHVRRIDSLYKKHHEWLEDFWLRMKK